MKNPSVQIVWGTQKNLPYTFACTMYTMVPPRFKKGYPFLVWGGWGSKQLKRQAEIFWGKSEYTLCT